MKDKCVIFAGGEFNADAYKSFDFSDFDILAADSGYINALKLGLNPDAVFGDFDSMNEPNGEFIKIKLPSEKDDTDTMMAARYCVENGYKEVKILGALGGRFDHSFANIQTLYFLSKNNIKSEILGFNERIFFVTNENITLKREKDTYLSVFSYGEKCEGVSLYSTKYELIDASIENSFPIGVSNEFKNDIAEISVKNGSLLVVITGK